MRTSLRVAMVGSLMALVVAVPVGAAAPDRGRDGFDFEWVFAECDGFDIVGIGSYAEQWTVFADRDGLPYEIVQIGMDFDLYRTDTDSLVGTGMGHTTLHAPLDGTPQSTFTGVRIMERYASGSVLTEVGRVVFDTNGEPTFIAGPHPFETTGVDRCAYVPA